jgi:hypothetical protein
VGRDSFNAGCVYMSINWPEIGRAMAQAVSRRPLTTDARVRSRVSPCGIFVVDKVALGQVFPYQFHSTGAPLYGKTKNHIHHRVAQ